MTPALRAYPRHEGPKTLAGVYLALGALALAVLALVGPPILAALQ